MKRVVAVAAVVLLLAGCTAPPPVAPPPAASPERALARYTDPIRTYADGRLSIMTLDQKIASMLMVHVPGTDASAIGSTAAGYGLGGVILMGDNVPDPASALADMTPVIAGEPGLPVLIAMDQEGGIVRRIKTDVGPAAAQLRNDSPDAARAAFLDRGALLQSVGVTVNFGIVADVTADTSSFIYSRTLGNTADEAAPRVAAAVEGEAGEVLSTLKHFPGHGVAPGDSHSSIPTTGISLDDWRAGHESPFAAGIDAGAEFVMFGHLQFDAIDPVPATLSLAWHDLLRDELGFDGISITDDMNMLENSGRPEYANQAANAVAAVAAGNTMLLYVQGVDVPTVVGAIRDAVLAGTINPSVVDDAAHRLLVLRRTLSGQTGPFAHCFEECLAVIE